MAKIKEEDMRIKQREVEREEKQQRLQMLKAKDERIKRRMAAIKIYDDYLNDVRSANQDEFQEVADILRRHTTLLGEQERLEQKGRELHEGLEAKRKEKEKYNSQTASKKLELNNSIGIVKHQLEEIVDEINNTKAQAADVSQIHRNQRSKLSQSIMAVNNVYEQCGKRVTGKSLYAPAMSLFSDQKHLQDDFEKSTDLVIV